MFSAWSADRRRVVPFVRTVYTGGGVITIFSFPLCFPRPTRTLYTLLPAFVRRFDFSAVRAAETRVRAGGTRPRALTDVRKSPKSHVTPRADDDEMQEERKKIYKEVTLVTDHGVSASGRYRSTCPFLSNVPAGDHRRHVCWRMNNSTDGTRSVVPVHSSSF